MELEKFHVYSSNPNFKPILANSANLVYRECNPRQKTKKKSLEVEHLLSQEIIARTKSPT